MTKRKSTRPNRLADRYVRIRPEGGRKVPYRVPELKAFDPCMRGQGQFDFSSDDPDAIVYPEDEEQLDDLAGAIEQMAGGGDGDDAGGTPALRAAPPPPPRAATTTERTAP